MLGKDRPVRRNDGAGSAFEWHGRHKSFARKLG